MLFRLVLLVIAGTLLIGGAFLWINHINDETRMTEELNNVLPPKKVAVKSSPVAVKPSSVAATTTTTTTNTNVVTSIGNQINNLQDTIKNIPNALMPADSAAQKGDSSELVASKLALSSQSMGYALPAITRQQAEPLAKESAGKTDPLSPIEGLNYKPFPRSGAREVTRVPGAKNDNGNAAHKVDLIPPPPPGSIPPPPPPLLAGQGDSLPVNELPTPPERPSIAKYLKVVGILGDRAFMAVTDANVRRANRLPKVVAVSPGDRVDFVSVVAVSDNSVTLEEDGHTVVKRISVLR